MRRGCSRLPSSYPVQKNLLEVFPNGVWQVKLPAGTGDRGTHVVLVVAVGAPGEGQIRSEITLN